MATKNNQQYVQKCIIQALKAAGGNKARALQQVMAWAAKDMNLLQGLTRAHLNGIVAYHIERVASRQGGGTMNNVSPAPRIKPQASQPKREMVKPSQGNAFGQQILRAASSGNAQMFGMESYQSPTRPSEEDGKTSQRHIDAMMHIASFAQKGDMPS